MKKITKKIIAILLIATMLCTVSACGGSDDECSICGGSGYYQKKDCPACP